MMKAKESFQALIFVNLQSRHIQYPPYIMSLHNPLCVSPKVHFCFTHKTFQHWITCTQMLCTPNRVNCWIRHDESISTISMRKSKSGQLPRGRLFSSVSNIHVRVYGGPVIYLSSASNNLKNDCQVPPQKTIFFALCACSSLSLVSALWSFPGDLIKWSVRTWV